MWGSRSKYISFFSREYASHSSKMDSWVLVRASFPSLFKEYVRLTNSGWHSVAIHMRDTFLERGLASSSFHMISCRSPPTLMITFGYPRRCLVMVSWLGMKSVDVLENVQLWKGTQYTKDNSRSYKIIILVKVQFCFARDSSAITQITLEKYHRYSWIMTDFYLKEDGKK